jgi:hypothetical protein
LIRSRVVAARNVQLRRFYDEKIYTNAQMGPSHILAHVTGLYLAKEHI